MIDTAADDDYSCGVMEDNVESSDNNSFVGSGGMEDIM